MFDITPWVNLAVPILLLIAIATAIDWGKKVLAQLTQIAAPLQSIDPKTGTAPHQPYYRLGLLFVWARAESAGDGAGPYPRRRRGRDRTVVDLGESVGQSRKDREWPRPRRVRHVWVLPHKRDDGVMQGLVVGWRRHSHHWSALVVMVDDRRDDTEQTVVQTWVPLERLRPVRTDPNHIAKFSWFTERTQQRT